MKTSSTRRALQFLPVILAIANVFVSRVQADEDKPLSSPPRTNMLPRQPFGILTNSLADPRLGTREQKIEALSQSIITYESMLANPKLRPKDRDRLQITLARVKGYRLAYLTNASLGVNTVTNIVVPQALAPQPPTPVLPAPVATNYGTPFDKSKQTP